MALDNHPLLAPAVVLSPVTNAGWDSSAVQSSVAALVAAVVAEHGVDPDRVYVTGVSMGGAGTFALAASPHGRLFAAAAPVCGWLAGRSAAAAALKALPMCARAAGSVGPQCGPWGAPFSFHFLSHYLP